MARQMTEKNAALKAYLVEHPQAKFSEVASVLTNFTFTPQEVSAMKSKLNGGNGRIQGLLSTIQTGTNFVNAVGSTKFAMELLDVIDKLGGTKTARELITSVIPVVGEENEAA